MEMRHLDSPSRDPQNVKKKLVCTYSSLQLFDSVTTSWDHALMHKALLRFHISWIWRWGISTLQVAIPKTPKRSFSACTLLFSSSMVWPPSETTRLCINHFSWIHISWVWRWGISTHQVVIPETPRWSWDQQSTISMSLRSISHHEFASRDSFEGGPCHSKLW